MKEHDAIIRFAAKAVLVPFKKCGRGWDGWDCAGMVQFAYREIYGTDIGDSSGDYTPESSYKELAALFDRERPMWVEVSPPAPGDVALYRVGKYAMHIGFVIPWRGHLGLLHCEENIGTVLEPLNTRAWSKRIEGYYRHTSRT